MSEQEELDQLYARAAAEDARALDRDTHYGLDYILDGVALGDVIVRGRKLREFSATEFTSYDDAVEFAQEVFAAVSVGDDLDQIFDKDFHKAFYEHRNSFLDADVRRQASDRIYAMARRVFGDSVKLEMLSNFEVAHMGWEMDNHYAAVRVDGAVRYVGTNHGGACEQSRERLEKLRDGLREQLNTLNAALALGDTK